MSEITLPFVPDFFIVGAPKCGTTALVAYLSQNLGIFIPPIKEPHYFCTDFPRFRRITSARAYADLFAAARPDQVTGEASVWYLYSQTAAREIHAAAPNARIIVMTRDPLAMLPSLHNQLVFSGREDVETFASAWALTGARKEGRAIPEKAVEPSHLYYDDVADFAPQIQRFRAVFGDAQVMVVDFEDFKANTPEVVDTVTGFIGAHPASGIDFAVINAARQHRFPQIAKLLRHPPWPISGVKIALKQIPYVRKNPPLRWLYDLMSRKANVAPLSDSLAAEIRARYDARGSAEGPER